MKQPFELVKTEQGFYLRGNITFQNVMAIAQQGKALIAASSQLRVEINLEKVVICHSTSLPLLLAWMRFAKQKEKRIVWVALPKPLSAMAKVCNITSILGLGGASG